MSRIRSLLVLLACSLVVPTASAVAQCGGTATISGSGTYVSTAGGSADYAFSLLVPECPTPLFSVAGEGFLLDYVDALWSVDGVVTTASVRAGFGFFVDDPDNLSFGGFNIEFLEVPDIVAAFPDFTGPQLFAGSVDAPVLQAFATEDMSEFTPTPFSDGKLNFERFAIEINRVPEPASFALLIIGFAAIGLRGSARSLRHREQ